MKDKGNLFSNNSDWEQVLKKHSKKIIPENVWGLRLLVNGTPFIPTIQSEDNRCGERHRVGKAVFIQLVRIGPKALCDVIRSGQ
ncbi:MAG: hypothetical protein ACREE6_09375 [Limisphaerales bacterium]